jgi:WD40 repeat protein
VTTGQELHCFREHTDWVTSVAFSPDGQYVLSGSADESVLLWAVATGQRLHRFPGNAGVVWSVAFSPDGQQVLSGHSDGSIRLWDIATKQVVHRFTGHAGWVRSVTFNPNGQHVLSGSDDGSIRLWDVATGACLLTLFGTQNGWMAFTPDGQYKFDGDLARRFWFLIGLCRFEPGELDAYLPPERLQRLPLGTPMLPPAAPRKDASRE